MNYFGLKSTLKTTTNTFARFGVHSIVNLRFAIAVFFCTLLMACATGSRETLHSFEFNAFDDSPDVEIMDYRYRNTNGNGVEAYKPDLARGIVRQRIAIGGYMPRGDSLYVKWRIKKTGMIYEDTVSLKERLPKNIESHIVYFIVDKTTLKIYLITPDMRPEGQYRVGPYKWDSRKIFIVYPDNISTLTR